MNSIRIKLIYFWFSIALFCACEKEHLNPGPSSTSSAEPVVYITTKMDGDSVYFAGGVKGYAGIPSYQDTGLNRIFNFTLEQTSQSQRSSFKISINNYSIVQGDPQADLDSSVFVSSRNYGSGIFFTPLNAGITWYDSTGNEFKSVSTNSNSFSINNVEDIEYETKKYKKTSITFDCFLVHNFTDSIHLTDGEAIIMFSVE